MLPAPRGGTGGTAGETYNPARSHEAPETIAECAPPPGVYTLPSSGETGAPLAGGANHTLSADDWATGHPNAPPPSYDQATTRT